MIKNFYFCIFALTIFSRTYNAFSVDINSNSIRKFLKIGRLKSQDHKSTTGLLIFQNRNIHTEIAEIKMLENFSIISKTKNIITWPGGPKILIKPNTALRVEFPEKNKTVISIRGRIVVFGVQEKETLKSEIRIGSWRFSLNEQILLVEQLTGKSGNISVYSGSGNLVSSKFEKEVVVRAGEKWKTKDPFILYPLSIASLQDILRISKRYRKELSISKPSNEDVIKNYRYFEYLIQRSKISSQDDILVYAEVLWQTNQRGKSISLLKRHNSAKNLVRYRQLLIAADREEWQRVISTAGKISNKYLKKYNLTCQIDFYKAVAYFKLKNYTRAQNLVEIIQEEKKNCQPGILDSVEIIESTMSSHRGLIPKISFGAVKLESSLPANQQDIEIDISPSLAKYFSIDMNIWDDNYLGTRPRKSVNSINFNQVQYSPSTLEPVNSLQYRYQIFSLDSTDRFYGFKSAVSGMSLMSFDTSERFVKSYLRVNLSRISLNSDVLIDTKKRKQTNFGKWTNKQSIRLVDLLLDNYRIQFDLQLSQVRGFIKSDISGNEYGFGYTNILGYRFDNIKFWLVLSAENRHLKYSQNVTQDRFTIEVRSTYSPKQGLDLTFTYYKKNQKFTTKFSNFIDSFLGLTLSWSLL